MYSAPPQKKKLGAVYQFDNQAFIRSLPPDHAAYMEMLQQTQAWNEFVMDREENVSKGSIALFDAIIMAKRGRAGLLRSSLPGLGRKGFVPRSSSGSTRADFLSDTSQHQWRIVAVQGSSERPDLGSAAKGRDYHSIITRTPAKLEDGLFKQEETVPELPTIIPKKTRATTLTGRMNGLGMHAP